MKQRAELVRGYLQQEAALRKQWKGLHAQLSATSTTSTSSSSSSEATSSSASGGGNGAWEQIRVIRAQKASANQLYEQALSGMEESLGATPRGTKEHKSVQEDIVSLEAQHRKQMRGYNAQVKALKAKALAVATTSTEMTEAIGGSSEAGAASGPAAGMTESATGTDEEIAVITESMKSVTAGYRAQMANLTQQLNQTAPKSQERKKIMKQIVQTKLQYRQEMQACSPAAVFDACVMSDALISDAWMSDALCLMRAGACPLSLPANRPTTRRFRPTSPTRTAWPPPAARTPTSSATPSISLRPSPPPPPPTSTPTPPSASTSSR